MAAQDGKAVDASTTPHAGCSVPFNFLSYCASEGIEAYDINALHSSKLTPHHILNFTHYYCCDVGGVQGNDHFLYRHPNGLVLVGLAPSHVALQAGKNIEHVDFNVGKRNRQTDLEVSGKAKKNAWRLEANSALCRVCVSDGISYTIRCCIKGALLEVNEHLPHSPRLLQEKHATLGFVAILMPKSDSWMEDGSVATKEEYSLRTKKLPYAKLPL